MPLSEHADTPIHPYTDTSPLVAVVPAAGMSVRMGQNKLLLTFQGKPLIAHAVDTLLASAVDEVVVVLGHEADRVREKLRGKKVRFIENPDCGLAPRDSRTLSSSGRWQFRFPTRWPSSNSIATSAACSPCAPACVVTVSANRLFSMNSGYRARWSVMTSGALTFVAFV
jgi:hypothetical protein